MIHTCELHVRTWKYQALLERFERLYPDDGSKYIAIFDFPGTRMPRMLYNHMLRLKVERVQLSVYMGSQAHVRALAAIVREYGGKIRVYRVEEVPL